MYMSTIPEIKISACDHFNIDILKSKKCIHLQISKVEHIEYVCDLYI
jgi:hypothetical protein